MEINFEDYKTWKENPSSNVFDYNSIKDQLFITVSNAVENEQLLQNAPHKTVEDLAITYNIKFNDNQSIPSVPINNDLFDSMHVSLEQLHQDAVKNSAVIMPARIHTLQEAAHVDSIQNPYDPANSIYVVTTDKMVNGAAALFYDGMMANIANQFKEDYYILPSSMHEVIVLPVSFDQSVESLERTVRDVNTHVVNKRDQLSDHVYHYDRDKDRFSIAKSESVERDISDSYDVDPGHEFDNISEQSHHSRSYKFHF